MAGCYTQVPIATTPAPMTRIVAQVTDTGTVVMGNQIGPGALEVEGVVDEATAAYLKLRMSRVDQRGGYSSSWKGEVVSFPRNALTNITQKKLDKTRSWMAAAAVTVGAILVGRAFHLFQPGNSGDGGPIVPS